MKANVAPPMIEVWIRPSRGWMAVNWRELWEYRELLWLFVWRDIAVRYKQTVLGASWAIIQPLLMMVVFSIFFGRLAGVSSEGVPYPIFSYAALVPWIFFANGVTAAANSLVGNAGILKKVYFPRLMLPMSAVMAGLLDFVLAFLVLLGMMMFYNIQIQATILWTPFFLLLAMATAVGVSLWLSALNVEFRDVRYIVPFLIQLWLFATPVAYPSTIIPEPWQTLYGLNPMVGVVEGFRWALLGTPPGPGWMTGLSAVVALALLVTGAFYFRRMEKAFADVV